MKRALPLFFFSLLFLGGCIEFERQTLTYSHDSRSDTLKIFQHYHGIFAGDATNSLSSEEVQQLDSVLNGQRTFFFGNWITEISHNVLRDQLKDLKEAAANGTLKPADAHLEPLVNLLLTHVRIENGGFYLDADGKLSGVQRVTITGVSNLIAAANVVIRDAYKAEADDPSTNEQERRLYLKSTEQPRQYIKLEGNRIIVRLPVTKEQYDKQVLQGETPKAMEEFKKGGGQLRFKDDELVASLGEPTDQVTTLAMSFSDKTYSTNLLAEVKKRGLIQEKLDPEAAAKAFFSAAKK